MISDFQILGIDPTKDVSVIKEAYHRKAKEIHPDFNSLSFESHLKFIVLQQAYQRLISDRKPAAESAVMPHNSPKSSEEIVPSKDAAYSFYKAGIREFSRLHPSAWRDKTETIIIALNEEDLNKLRQMEKTVRDLVRVLPRAYYYFSMVVNEYPESIWAADSRDKLARIEQQTVRYKKIIKSFLNHATLAKRVNKMF